ncbi:MAG: glycoside hydrolase family 43 protein [Planctomycetota bacterium]
MLSRLLLLIAIGALSACSQRQTRWTIDPSYRAPTQNAGTSAPKARNATKHYVFTSFRDVHPPTTHLLYSNDGYRWRTLFDDRPILAAKPGMRDAHLSRGPGGTFHMLWTNADFGEFVPTISHAWSRDLVEWSEPRHLPVMASVPGVRHCWAPEAFYMPDRREWLVHWSSTVDGFAPPETAWGEPVGNHRIWAATTKDFRGFSEPFALFDPGYTVIDSTILPVEGALGTSYYLFFKDERREPRQKAIRVATGSSPMGPWSEPSDTLTRPWSEAPSAIRIDGDWMLYWDAYSKGFYGGSRSADLMTWDDITRRLRFPPGHRHGSVLEIDAETARRLLEADAGASSS